MSEINTPEQAKQALAEIRRAAEANDGRIGQMEQAVQAVRDSVRAMSEQVNRAEMAGHNQTASEREIVERYTYERGGEKAVRMIGETGRDGVYRTGLLDDQTTYSDWQRRLQQLVTRRSLVRLFAGARGSESFARSPQCDHDIAQHLRAAPVGFQRIFGDGSNIGAEWIPDVTLPEVDRYVTAGRRVEALFRTMPMSDKTVIMPKLTVGLRPYLKGASVIDDPAQYTASSLTTDSKTITANSWAVRVQVDDDASEDSIVAVEEILRDELVAALVDGFEDTILNGDTGSHQDTGLSGWDIRSRWGASGLGTSADHRRAFIGLRARAADVSNTSDGSSAETFAGLLSQRATLDSPLGLDSVVCITSPEYYLAKMLNFTETLTLDKFGPQATVLTGQIASVGGMPVIISEFMSNELNTSGIYDDSTKTKTGVLVVNTSRFFVGARRGAVVEVQRDATRGLNHYIVTARKTFDTPDPVASKKNVHFSYNHSIS